MNAIPITRTRRASNSERRRYLRYEVRCACWLESEHASVFGSTADVGLGGLFLRTAVPLEQGQRVRVELTLARGGEAVTAEGLVTRAVRARLGQRHGVGVEFIDISTGRDGLTELLTAR